MITAKLTEEYSILATNTYEKLPIVQDTKLGNSFTISNNQIVIGSNVKYVEISASTTILANGGAGNKYVRIQKNNTPISVGRSNISQGSSILMGFTPIIIGVNEGDKIEFDIYGTQADKVWGISSERRTYITVKKIS
jgi:hypothetical protein